MSGISVVLGTGQGGFRHTGARRVNLRQRSHLQSVQAFLPLFETLFNICPRPPAPPPPCPADDPLVASIAQQYLADREAHDKTAAEWAKRYASA